MIVIEGLGKKYGQTPALSDVSFTVQPGEFLCLTGAGGSGKSTLLNLLLLAEPPSAGSILVDDMNIVKISGAAKRLFRQRVGMVYQDCKLFPTWTVAENVAMPLEVCGAKPAIVAARTAEVLEQFGLTAFANRPASSLSTGEQALVAIARGVVHKPMIVMLDEPTAHLDQKTSIAVLKVLRSLQVSGVTILFCTKDLLLLEALKCRTITLEGGKVLSDSGTPAPAKKNEPAAAEPKVSPEPETPSAAQAVKVEAE